MKKINQLSLLIVYTLCLSVFSSSLCSQTERYVVVLSMDGFRSDYPKLVHTPTLDSLERIGVRTGFRPSFPSNTFPNHVSMATGLHPDHHGIINNSFYAPDLDAIYNYKNTKAVTNPDFYKGEPIWNTAEKQGVRTGVFYWVGSEAPIENRSPSLLKKYNKSVPYKERVDTVISWLKLPPKERPQLIMWYVEEPDGVAHKFTSESPEVLNQIEELDKLLNYFFSQARTLDIFEKINFIIVSDHGMATYTPENCINLNDYVNKEWFDHIFEGIPTLLYPKENYKDTVYSLLQQVPSVQVWRKDEIPEQYVYGKNERVGDIVVLPDVGYSLQFRETYFPHQAGAHGYDNFHPLMEGVFYGSGPSFKHKSDFPTMANVNLYLIISHLLSLTPQPTDGKPEIISALFE